MGAYVSSNRIDFEHGEANMQCRWPFHSPTLRLPCGDLLQQSVTPVQVVCMSTHSGELMTTLLPFCLALLSPVQVSLYLLHGAIAQLIASLICARDDYMGLTLDCIGDLTPSRRIPVSFSPIWFPSIYTASRFLSLPLHPFSPPSRPSHLHGTQSTHTPAPILCNPPWSFPLPRQPHRPRPHRISRHLIRFFRFQMLPRFPPCP